MNKKQKIVLVVVAVALCTVILITPQKVKISGGGLKGTIVRERDIADEKYKKVTTPVILWNIIFQRSLVTLIAGTAAFVLLGDKNK